MEDQKLKKLIKTCERAKKKCRNLLTTKFNEEIGRGDLIDANRGSNDKVLQKLYKHIVMASCTITDACDKIMGMKLNSSQFGELITTIIDSLALMYLNEFVQFKNIKTKRSSIMPLY